MKEEHFPRIEDKLRLFIMCADNGRAPPEWLMQYMADGAREFLAGGKPWQRGGGGRPSRISEQDRIAFLLHQIGGMAPQDIVDALGIGEETGSDKTRTIRRNIERGRPYGLADATHGALGALRGGHGVQYYHLLETLAAVEGLDLRDYPDATDRLTALRKLIAEHEADINREPGYE